MRQLSGTFVGVVIVVVHLPVCCLFSLHVQTLTTTQNDSMDEVVEATKKMEPGFNARTKQDPRYSSIKLGNPETENLVGALKDENVHQKLSRTTSTRRSAEILRLVTKRSPVTCCLCACRLSGGVC